MHVPSRLPAYAHSIVVGGGTAGSALAGLLAERSEGSVLLLEAGPDYGAFSGGGWPDDLLDADRLATTHEWGYDSGATYPNRRVAFQRARVLGGCSSHNGCAAIWGHRTDYDMWAEAGNHGWATDDLLPLFRAVDERLRVTRYTADEITPFQQAFLEAGEAAGVPIVEDLNDLDADVGVAPAPVNIVDGVRWNAAFAYLDPVRERPNLTICGHVLVDRLVIERSRCVGVVVVSESGPETIEAERVIVAAGAYGSPAILLRSGVGEPQMLRAVGIDPIHPLPGVGLNLHDHPAIVLTFAGTERLERAMSEFGGDRRVREEQAIAKLRSDGCEKAFDLHMYPVSSRTDDGGWSWTLPVACMVPRSRGLVTLRSPEPAVAPVIEHRYLGDPGGHDRALLAEGIRLAREIAGQAPLADLLGDELEEGPSLVDGQEIDAHCVHYFHPAGTCKMGPARDQDAVVDPSGRVHGLDNVYVADASIMPVIPRANTNVPTAVIGEKIAAGLLDGM